MTEKATRIPWRDRLRWWLYEICFAYCVRCVHPDADAAEFTILDTTNFVAISKDEIREIIFEAPAIAWHFEDPEEIAQATR